MENNEEPSELAKALTLAMNAVSAPLNERLAEADAMLSTHRFLLEVMYSNAFLTNPDGLDALMAGLLRSVRASPTKSVPMQADDVIERQARIATHLERFRTSVKDRIAQDQQG